MTSTSTIDSVGGTSFYDNVAAFTINKLAAAKSNEIKLMILARLFVIVKDNNGKYWSLGADAFAEGSSLIAQTGQAFGDANQYALTFQGLEVEPAEEIATADGTLADALTGYTVG